MAETLPDTIGRYRVQGILGRGAMGVVYKAVDPMIDREVAIKTIRLSLSEEELALYEARFAQEVKTVGKLNHAHIVTIYDVGRTEQFAYMAMEYIDGRELKAYLAPGRPADTATAVDLAAQIADGLAFAHARDIIHRDVKPSNVMVAVDDGRMVAKVMDFGIARAPASTVKTMTGMILGSPRYMSPEQVIGRNVGPHSDIFSLGVVLYEMLTGAAPFDADSVSSIMYQTVHVEPEAPSRVNPALPGPLDAIVARAMAKAPEERFASMRDFCRALREAGRALPEPQVLEIVPAAIAGTSTVPPVTASVPAMVATADLPASTPPAPAAGQPATAMPPAADRSPTLSREFDSLVGTLRLAELTGTAPEVTQFLRREGIAAPTAPAKTTEPPAAPPAAFPVAPAALLGTLALVAAVLAAFALR